MVFARSRMQVFACSILAFLFSTQSWAQSAPGHPPVEAFGTLPEVSRPAITPDGKHIATVEPFKGRPAAVIRSLENAAAPPVILPNDKGFIVAVEWANDQRLLITLNLNQSAWGETTISPWYRTVSVDLAGNNAVLLFSNKREVQEHNGAVSSIEARSVDAPNIVYMSMYLNPDKNNEQDYRLTLFRVDVTTGKAESVTRGGSATANWIADEHGKVLARIDETLHPFVDHLLLNNNGDWTEVESAPASEGIGVFGLTMDGSGLVIAQTNRDTGMYELVVRNLANGTKTTLYKEPKHDIGGALVDRWTGRVVGVQSTVNHYFDPELQALQNALQASFPAMDVNILEWDRARQKVIFTTESPRSPPSYYLLDRTTHKATSLALTYQSLPDNDLGEMKEYPYKARDGLDIPAYLTLPPGKQPQKLPVVIMPHGGPMAHDKIGFDWMAQFLANRGYAVLQPNFRGSSGYGQAFEVAGYGQWGLKMQDDVTDGVKKLIADGIADPKRICIVGWSYGGYAGLAGAAFTPDLYACAAGGAGVYDIRHFLTTRALDYGLDSAMIASWSIYIGDRQDDAAKLDAASPTENADKIKCPILLVHGTDDSTVRIDQSEEMESALRRAGKKVRFVTIPKETHYLMTSASRILWLSELEKFLNENIGH